MNQVFPTVFACEVDYNWVESVPMSGKKLDSTFFWIDLDHGSIDPRVHSI